MTSWPTRDPLVSTAHEPVSLVAMLRVASDAELTYAQRGHDENV